MSDPVSVDLAGLFGEDVLGGINHDLRSTLDEKWTAFQREFQEQRIQTEKDNVEKGNLDL